MYIFTFVYIKFSLISRGVHKIICSFPSGHSHDNSFKITLPLNSKHFRGEKVIFYAAISYFGQSAGTKMGVACHQRPPTIVPPQKRFIQRKGRIPFMDHMLLLVDLHHHHHHHCQQLYISCAYRCHFSRWGRLLKAHKAPAITM